MKVVYVHRFADNNIGDILSCPSHYFHEGKHYDILKQDPIATDADILIVGGGNIFVPAGWDKKIERWCELHPKAKRVAWGTGGKPTDGFHLVGSREVDVPCASCLHPDIRIEDGEGEVRISHFRDKIKAPIDNRQPGVDYIKLIREAEKVVTTSFHMAYWGWLMNKQVDLQISGGKYEFISPDMDLEECRYINNEFAKKVYS